MLKKNCAIGLFANCSAKSKQIVYTQTTERMSCRLSLLLQIARVWVCMCVCEYTLKTTEFHSLLISEKKTTHAIFVAICNCTSVCVGYVCMYTCTYAHSLDSLQLCNMLIVSRGSWAWQVQKTQPRFLLPQHLLPFLFTETSSHFQPHSRVQHSCSSRRLIAVIGRVFHTFHERS